MKFVVPACPLLPQAEDSLTASSVTGFGTDRGPAFYLASLRYGQCLWQRGLPAQAILQINKAFSADLTADARVLTDFPWPYATIAYFLTHQRLGDFIGNPRRHWQHLATRMVGPRATLRTWRAWACWHLACKLMPDQPADEEQIAKEGIQEPSEEEIFAHLEKLTHPTEVEIYRQVLLTVA